MSRTEFGIASGLSWLVLVGGAVALAVCRRRAPRAVGFALPVVVILTVISGYMPLVMIAGPRFPAGWHQAIRDPYNAVALPSISAGVVLLVVAAMMDRRPREAR